ncbi:autotransporter assembly complex protein TamA [Salinarimonas chemoclinalis]|uniref:autotransporter assembly complex protein TamA n=1 Tax=Salinarimonas chemoclinalis TaxID=3241599 RepID=UPI0035590716
MALRNQDEGRKTKALLVFLVALGLTLPAPPARAQFDFFGLFGGGDEEPPAPSAEALPYDLDIVVEGEVDIEDAFETISTLYRLRGDPPPDAEALVRRAQSDLVPFIDALWGLGYYNARVRIDVAGVPLTIRGENAAAAAAAARGFRGGALVPVRVTVEPGEVFRVRALRVLGPDGGPLALPEGVYALEPGDEAASAAILAAQANIVDYYRAASRPLAAIAGIDPVVVHPERALDLTIRVEPGPVAGIGPIAVGGNEDVPESVIRSFIYTEPGDPYSPDALAAIRRSIGRIEAISSVRVNEANALDQNGDLPLEVVVSERLKRLFGVSASYSTSDGPAASIYWAHRNLFGGAERLRLEATALYLTQTGARAQRNADEWWDDVGGKVSASFIKPALWGTRNDFLADAFVSRDRTAGYTAELVNVTAGIRHRFGDGFNVQAGIEYETGRGTDVLGKYDYTLVGLLLSAELDGSDSRLGPREGYRLRAGVTPYLEAFGSTTAFTYARADGSVYLPLDARKRFVVAARVGLGSIAGAELNEVPANRRFYAGGGGSVRGYAYRSLGPRIGREPIGGRSLFEASLEARLRVTNTIGIVPFVDAGSAFRESYPSFDEELRFAAGIGVRYHTAIGPLRADIAFPLNPGKGDDAFGLYLGIGQAF